MLYSILYAFLFGGGLCMIAQIIINLTSLTPARILVLYVCLGVLIGGIGIYEPLRDIFGCGISLPLIGFGSNIASGVREAVDSEGLIGALSGPLTAASTGIGFTLTLGFFLSLFFKGKKKKM